MMYCKTRDIDAIYYGTEGSKPKMYASTTGGSIPYGLCYHGCPGLDDVEGWEDWAVNQAAYIPVSFSYPYIGTEKFCSSKRGYGRFNDCHHMRNHVVNYPFTFAYDTNGRNLSFMQYIMYRVGPPMVAPGENVYKHPPLDLRAARTTAWHTMQPEFEGKVSMLNFIFELKDFRDMAKVMANKPLKQLASMFNRNTRRSPVSAPNAANRALDAIAEARLVNEFAIKPLIQDIITIHLELKEMIDELQEDFYSAGTDENTRHYSEEFEHSASLSRDNFGGLFTGYRYTTLFTATLKYTYTYRMRSTLDAIKQYYGLNLTAEALWNAIPFSFLADYFVNIGKTLHIMEHDPNVRTIAHEYCESLLTANRLGSFILPGDVRTKTPVLVDHQHVTSDTLVTGTESSLYTRRVAWPDYGPVAPRFKLPSYGQNLNMLALAKSLL